jgi:uncharacterized protein
LALGEPNLRSVAPTERCEKKTTDGKFARNTSRPERLDARVRHDLDRSTATRQIERMSMYSATVPQFAKMLRNLEGWLNKAEAHAAARKFDVDTLLSARLAPDMFPLGKQIQSACDNAKFACARLAGKQPPSDPDTETRVSELRARIQKTIAFVESIAEEDFKEASSRLIGMNYLPPTKRIVGHIYLNQQVLPNFYFHAAMAYAILRHNGVDVGKSDFLGPVPMVDV